MRPLQLARHVLSDSAMMSSVATARSTEPAARTQRDADDESHQRIGNSLAFKRILDRVDTVASTGATVLIVGETGTGKEVIARLLHRRSKHANGAFVPLNCAAVPSNLLESELFGHEKGAFTGALTRRTGRFELAHDGTLFLDEVGEMSADLQPKLLRVLQERQFERVGGCTTIRSNTRLIAATHRDLGAMVDAGTFREDLYYRLNVFPIRVPPLRERREDIPLLAEAFVRQFAAASGRASVELSESALAELRDYDWPGNIRELRNIIERTLILTSGDRIETIDWGESRKRKPTGCGDALEAIQRAHILSVLDKANWVVGGRHGAAARLGLNRSTLNFRMKKLGISRPESSR